MLAGLAGGLAVVPKHLATQLVHPLRAASHTKPYDEQHAFTSSHCPLNEYQQYTILIHS